MPIRTVMLGLIVEDEAVPTIASEYALALAEAERSHLVSRILAPNVDLPTGRLLPLVQAMVDQVNDDRGARAQELSNKLVKSGALSGVTIDVRISQEPYAVGRADLINASRASDLIILPQSNGVLSFEAGLVEGVLFGSGRPVLVVPTEWQRGPRFKNVVVAWDGGARSARAVGDALPLLSRADEVEIVCIAEETKQSVLGTELAEHLARHCKSVRVTDLSITHDDAGWTLRDHLDSIDADLMVMGAYAHARVLQFVFGGVTSQMLTCAGLPVFFSY